jgi:hypothetical protein
MAGAAAADVELTAPAMAALAATTNSALPTLVFRFASILPTFNVQLL